jgi:anaphase-promoting complex subunit 3
MNLYSIAVKSNPHSILLRFKYAKSLISRKRYDEALSELKKILEMAPREANIHFLLGKIYHRRGDKLAALRHLTWARDLEHHDPHVIIKYIEQLDKDPDEEERNGDDTILTVGNTSDYLMHLE